MKKVLFFFYALVIFPLFCFAQPSNDAGLWASATIEKKLNKKISLSITEEYRRRENFTALNLLYTDLGAIYKPFDFLKISLVYRSIQKYLIAPNHGTDKTFSFRHRIMLNITVKRKFGNLEASFRERIQVENRDINSSPAGKMPEWYSRNKFEFKYDFHKPISPYVAVELRYQIHNPRAVEADRGWHRNRYFVGLDYKRNEKHSFGIYYMIQQEFNISSPQNLYIVGLEYNLSL